MPGKISVSVGTVPGLSASAARPSAVRAELHMAGGGGTLDHSALQNRDKADQHPIGAISGLEAELAGQRVEPMTNADIEMILGGFING